MNSPTLSGSGQAYTQNPYHPYTTPTSMSNTIQQSWQPTTPPTIEDRLSAIERQLNEIKNILEQIKWRV